MNSFYLYYKLEHFLFRTKVEHISSKNKNLFDFTAAVGQIAKCGKKFAQKQAIAHRISPIENARFVSVDRAEQEHVMNRCHFPGNTQ